MNQNHLATIMIFGYQTLVYTCLGCLLGRSSCKLVKHTEHGEILMLVMEVLQQQLILGDIFLL